MPRRDEPGREYAGIVVAEYVRRSQPLAMDPYERQSTTACCPRQTTPDSCSCWEGCICMCTDCICDGWGEEYDDE